MTYKICSEKQPDYLYAMLTPLIPPRSLRSIMVLTFLSSRLRPTLHGARVFRSWGPTLCIGSVSLSVLCGIGSLSLSAQLLQQYLSGDVWRHIFLIWLSLHKCLRTQLSVDIFGRSLGFGFWTLICFVRHWAWPPPGILAKWKYRFDWLIDWLNICSARQWHLRNTSVTSRSSCRLSKYV